MLKLIVVSGPDRREMSIDGQSATIGRAGECEIRITDLKSSRRHALLERQGDGWRLTDQDTPNKTVVNGRAVSTVDIRRGDEIRIGDTVLTVIDCDQPAAAVVAPPPPPPPDVPPPVPLERKLELKNKIEEVRARHAGPRGGPWKSVVGITVGTAAALAVLIGLKAMEGSGAPRPTDGPAPAKGNDLAEAKKVLASLQARAEGPATRDLIAEVNAAGRQYNETWMAASASKDATTPFDRLAATLLLKRAEQFNARFSRTAESVEQHLAGRRYSKALAELKEFRSSADDSFEEAVRALVVRVDEAVEADYAAVKAHGDGLDQAGRFDEAARHWAAHASRFEGTAFFAEMSGKPESLAAVARAAKEAAERRRKEEIARAEEVKRQVSVPQPSKQSPDTGKPIEPVKLPPFFARMAELANAGKFASKPHAWTGSAGVCTGAGPEGMTVDGKLVAWNQIDPAALVRAGVEALQGEDLLAAAEFGYALNAAAEANKALVKFLEGNNRKERQPKVDEVLARARGLASVPEGGYTYDAHAGWEDRGQRMNRLAVDDAGRHLKSFLSATSPKARDEQFGKMLAIYNDPALSAEVRERIRALAVSKLVDWKKKSLEDISKKARSSAAMISLRNLKMELNRRREAALKVIYDPKIYLPEDDPRWSQGDKVNGQQEVDRLVDDVKKLWNEPVKVAFEGSAVITREIDGLKAVNEKYLAALGETADTEAELKDYEEVMANLSSVLDIRSYCLNGKDKELHTWGRRVDRYHEQLNDKDIGADEKGHAKVVNDYREMMGRRRLFLDARICRATKKHSAVCDKEGRIWHVGKDGDPQSRARAEGFSAGVAENVALGYSSPVDTWWQGWYRASDHHRNGLAEAHNCLGYGYSGRVGTQNFSNIGPPKGF